MWTSRIVHCLALSMAATTVAGQCSLPSGMNQNSGAVDNTGFSSCHGQLKLGGTNNVQIVGENGELVQLMGISSHGLQWFPSCYTKESIQFLVENWGINLFRAAMYITEGGYSEGNPGVKDLVKSIVQWTRELGIYVIIDWHMLSPGDPNSHEYSEAPAFWAEMASLYKDEKHVIYEICNEPNGVSWPVIKSYADSIIPIIRNHDNDALIIVGTTVWSQGVHEVGANPVANPHNVMYTFHFYSGTHMSLYSRIQTESTRVPIFATEWGTSEASGDGGPYLSEAKQFLDLFIERNIAFSMWSYADKDEVSAALQEGACSSRSWDSVSCAGLFLKTYIKSKAQTCSGATAPSVPQVPPSTPSTPSTPTPPAASPVTPPSSPSTGSCSLYSRCDQDPNCCASGSCVAKDQWYSQCRNNCPRNWACQGTVPTTPTPPSTPRPVASPPTTPQPAVSQPSPPASSNCANPVSRWGNCRNNHCCADGYTCYEQSQWYAQCKDSCNSGGWTCNVLTA